jgi:hypothetical protein
MTNEPISNEPKTDVFGLRSALGSKDALGDKLRKIISLEEIRNQELLSVYVPPNGDPFDAYVRIGDVRLPWVLKLSTDFDMDVGMLTVTLTGFGKIDREDHFKKQP